jgi:hypothetical protein
MSTFEPVVSPILPSGHFFSASTLEELLVDLNWDDGSDC